MTHALDTVITSLRGVINAGRTKLKSLKTKKVTQFIAKCKTKLAHVTTMEGLTQTVKDIKTSIADTIAGVQSNGIKSLLEPLKEKLHKFLTKH